MSGAGFNTTVLLHGEDTGGEISAIEHTVPAGWNGPPLHRHDFDETFYVLEGELTFRLGEELLAARAGALVFAPRGAGHTLANPGEAPARYLLLRTPSSVEDPDAELVGPRIAERRINVLLRGGETGGRVALMDNAVAAGVEGPPLHHHDFDELFYVVEGELTFQLGDELVTRRRGELAFARRGAHHTFANLSGADARTLIVCTPAGFERYFDRMAARDAGVEPPPEALEPWPEVVVVGPRIGERPAEP
jgi:mannose-6-phosphate isomerase-like protein (cupin superfamily)